MVKFLKANKAVVLLQGRYAGRKAVIVKSFEEGTRDRPYGHCLVAGIAKYPSKVIRKDSAKKTAKKSRVKAFVKLVNYQHMMPTRYNLDVDLKEVLTVDALQTRDKKVAAKKEIKARLEDRFKSGKNRWFFTKLSRNLVRCLITLKGSIFETYLLQLSSKHPSSRLLIMSHDHHHHHQAPEVYPSPPPSGAVHENNQGGPYVVAPPVAYPMKHDGPEYPYQPPTYPEQQQQPAEAHHRRGDGFCTRCCFAMLSCFCDSCCMPLGSEAYLSNRTR
ncbi:unnamed protein product [Prunus brigantina]